MPSGLPMVTWTVDGTPTTPPGIPMPPPPTTPPPAGMFGTASELSDASHGPGPQPCGPHSPPAT